MDLIVPVIIIIIIVLIIVIYYKTKENFTQLPSELSMPTDIIKHDSVFLNFYKKEGNDFKLFDYIKRVSLFKLQPMWNGLGNRYNRNLFESPKLSPVIIVPGFGATPIFSKWYLQTSPGVKILDETENFEKNDSWYCKQIQENLKNIWGPEMNGLESFCWANVVKVSLSDGKIINNNGVSTTTNEMGSLEFLSDDYMGTLINSIESLGYRKGTNLFGAGYDFRKIGDEKYIDEWCEQLEKLIEFSCAQQEKNAVIIGHDLGAVVANYFLVKRKSEWKNKYIKSFVSVSGSFGGSPKALRTMLSGDTKSEIFNKTVRNFSGLSMLLPEPDVYGTNPLVHLNGISYTGSDIPKLISNVSDEASMIYKMTRKVKKESLKSPGVPVFIINGDNINTESSFDYKGTLLNDPVKNQPYYQIDLPNDRTFNYPDYFIGDGIIPKFALEYPIFWTKTQKEPINFKFFNQAEHTDILSMYDPTRYILSII